MTAGRAHAFGRPPLAPYALVGPNVRHEGTRILLISEYFPENLTRSVFGTFQRLRVLLDGAAAQAPVDLFFLWATADPFETDDLSRRYADLASAWGAKGNIWICRAGRPGKHHRILRSIAELPWMLRGAVGFTGGRPTMRSCGKSQGEVLRLALHRLRPSLILAHRQGAVAALRRADVLLPPVVTDMDDLEHVGFNRAAANSTTPVGRLSNRAWSALARYAEVRGLRRSRISLVCSEEDRQRVQALSPTADVRVLPNAVEDRPLTPLPDAPVVLFVGVFRYSPNAEAALWLLKKCWPQVLRAVPGTRLVLVGEDGQRVGAAMPALPGVEITGFLDSMSQAYEAARLVVCPIQRGTGTRIKIIEAAAYGRPVVATTIGAEGLAFADGREIVIRDRPDAFADACVALLRDRPMSERLGRAARELVRERYGRAGAVDRVNRIIAEVIAEGPAKAPR